MAGSGRRLDSLSPALPLSDVSASDGGNMPAPYSVSEISSRIKGLIEGHFETVRVRGELGRVSRPSSGHLYFDLKDSRSVLSAVSWRSSVSGFSFVPEEGLEVIATGRLTTYGGQSRYQLIVESLEISGSGALMALLERRKRALSAEGLFSVDKKIPLPFLPTVIGVVTSPTGSVIRDILHRLRDRFPVEVILWPVRVQGEGCGDDVSGAVLGFDAVPKENGDMPRPDLLIIARGGGSVEDLWGFNDESVIRAVSACRIPVISAIGHETDWTLLDLAADERCPTPSAAAERAVPVRADLFESVVSLSVRLRGQIRHRVSHCGVILGSFVRIFPAADLFLSSYRQRVDDLGISLPRTVMDFVRQRRFNFSELSPRLSFSLIRGYLDSCFYSFRSLCSRFDVYMESLMVSHRRDLSHISDLLSAYGYRNILRRGFVLVRSGAGLLVKSAHDLSVGDKISVEFHDGVRSGCVTDEEDVL